MSNSLDGVGERCALSSSEVCSGGVTVGGCSSERGFRVGPLVGKKVPEVVLDALSVVQVCSVLSEKVLGRGEPSVELELKLCRVRVSVVSLVKGRGSGLGVGDMVLTTRLVGSSSVGDGVS